VESGDMEMDSEDRPLGTEQVPLLIFELGGQFYGVDVDQVEAIVERQTSYQGQEIPVQDMALWIGLEMSKEGEASRLLLSRSGGALQGFLVDTPKDVIALSLDGIFPIPPLIRRVLGRSPLWGVGQWPQGLILLVDLAVDL
jgi:purine-binding chemotaxis protein CheW